MDESEMVRTFIETHGAPYYGQIIGSLKKPFANVVVKGDLVDIGL